MVTPPKRITRASNKPVTVNEIELLLQATKEEIISCVTSEINRITDTIHSLNARVTELEEKLNSICKEQLCFKEDLSKIQQKVLECNASFSKTYQECSNECNEGD